MQKKGKLKLNRQTIAILRDFDRVVGGGFPTITMIPGDSPPRPRPQTNSISPCCASQDGPCPTE